MFEDVDFAEGMVVGRRMLKAAGRMLYSRGVVVVGKVNGIEVFEDMRKEIGGIEVFEDMREGIEEFEELVEADIESDDGNTGVVVVVEKVIEIDTNICKNVEVEAAVAGEGDKVVYVEVEVAVAEEGYRADVEGRREFATAVGELLL